MSERTESGQRTVGYVGRVEFGVLGPLEVVEDGHRHGLGGPKQRTVLALLLAHAGRPVSTGSLIEAVYGDAAPDRAHRSIHTFVSNLRGELGDVIERQGDGYRFSADRLCLDACRFEDDIAESATIDDPEQCGQLLRSALGLWRGHAYADVDAFDGLTAEITRLTELRTTAIEQRVDADLESGRHRELIAELESLAVEYPLRERFCAQLMLALYRSDRQAEALRAYEHTRTHLVDELGLDPSPQLRDLEQRIIEQDPTLGLETRPAVTHGAVLVADIAEPNALAQLAPDARHRLISEQSASLDIAVTTHHGRIFAQRGPALYAWFANAADAASAAVAGQQATARVEPESLRLRMAIAAGEVEAAGDDQITGPPISRGAALVAVAHGGQVLLSSEAQRAVTESGEAGVVVRSLGQYAIDGLENGQVVHQLDIADLPTEFPPLRVGHAPPPLPLSERGIPGYELREEVGSGALGAVHRAYQPSVGREVAIKIIHPEFANRPEFIRRFEIEAQIVARLEHPHIVPLHDYWRTPDGAFLVMRWLRGGSLEDLLATSTLSLGEVNDLLAAIGPALAHAHRHGVVHRDLKASNVLFDADGNAYLSDFGIASSVGPGTAAVAADVAGLARLADRCLTEPPDPVDAVLAKATSEDPYFDVASFLGAWEQAIGGRDLGAEALRYTATRNPYKGLHAFSELDATDFHGRSTEVQELLDAVAAERLVTVVGPSGIGKSSVVRAGLIPELRRGAITGSEDWLVADLVPGTYPIEELTAALARVATQGPVGMEEDLRRDRRGLLRAVKQYLPKGARLLLIVDQFEELFTLTEEGERDAFLDLLTEAATDERSPIRIVVTLRADFVDYPLRRAELGEIMRSATVLIPTPSADELHAIVEEPAAGVGVRCDPGLADHLASQVLDQPGTLPLLEFSLTELFDHRDSDLLTLDAHEESGGVAGALGRRAEAIYADLDDDACDATRQVFLRLVNVSEEGRDTRRRVRRAELERLGDSDAALEASLAAFGDHRLLTFDRDPTTRGPTVEVAHEAILTQWPRLAGWIDEHREDLLLRNRLAAALSDWESADRNSVYLLAGGRLLQHEDWTTDTDLTLSTTEREFLAAGRRAEDERRASRSRTRRFIMAGFGIAAVIALVLAAAALVARNDARDNAAIAEIKSEEASASAVVAEGHAAEAEANAALARSRELAASAINSLDEDPELSLLLALSAASVAEPTPESIVAVRQAMASHRTIYTYTWPEDRRLSWLDGDISPDGAYLVVTGTADYVEMVEIASGNVVWSKELGVDDEGANYQGAEFIDDGATVILATSYRGNQAPPTGLPLGITFLDAMTGDVIRQLSVGPCGVEELGWYGVYGDDHAYVTAPQACGEGVEAGVVRVDLTTGAIESITEEWLPMVVTSADESRYALGPGTVIDRSTGEEIFSADVDAAALALSPDGSLLVAGARSLQVFDVEAGSKITDFHGHAGLAFNVWFNEDGTVAYSSGPGGEVLVWDPLTGRVMLEIAYGDSVNNSVMTPDGTRIASFSGTTAKVFDLRPGAAADLIGYAPYTDCGFWGNASWSAATDGALATMGLACENDPESELRISVFDALSGTISTQFIGNWGQYTDLSPDGSLVASEWAGDGLTGSVAVWDSAAGTLVRTMSGICPIPWMDAEAAEGCQAYPGTPFAADVAEVVFSPDGSRIVAKVFPAAQDPGLVVWDVATGNIVWTANGFGPDLMGVAWRPDGAALAVGTFDAITLLDADTGEPIAERSFEEGWAAPNADLAFTPDGSMIVATRLWWEAGDIAIVDAVTLETIHVIEGAHKAGIRTLDVSGAGDRIATGGADGTVKVHDLATYELVDTLPIFDDMATNVLFINDDRNLLLTSRDGPVLIMSLDRAEFLDLARDRLTRGFTATECATYGLDPCPTLEEISAGA